jgi:hypothetical protein
MIEIDRATNLLVAGGASASLFETYQWLREFLA